MLCFILVSRRRGQLEDFSWTLTGAVFLTVNFVVGLQGEARAPCYIFTAQKYCNVKSMLSVIYCNPRVAETLYNKITCNAILSIRIIIFFGVTVSYD